MQLTLQIVITALNDIGLSVSESKRLLNTVQQSMVQQQANEYTRQHIQCPHCLPARRVKGQQKLSTGHFLALSLYRGSGYTGAAAKKVQQSPSVCSATELTITLTRR